MNSILEALRDSNKNTPRRYEVVAKSEDEAEIYLYEGIGGYFGIDAGQFVKDLKAIKASTVHLRINSPGGEVNGARAIATAISQHRAKFVVHIDGIAASAASFLMLAADEIEISNGAFVMIHAPLTVTVGNAADHTATAELLTKYAEGMAADYSRRTGKDLATVQAWMDAETWFTAQEAVDAGLADRIVETVSPKNEWDLSAFKNTPEALRSAVVSAAAAPPQDKLQGAAPEENKQEVHMDNPIESKGQSTPPNPEVIAASAVTAERNRTSEITRIGALASMPSSVIQAAIAGGQSVEDFKTAVIDAKFKADQESGTDTRVGAESATIIRDEADTRRTLAQSAILAQVDTKYKAESGNPYRGLKIRRIAEEVLNRQGINTRGMDDLKFCVQAFHSTSDFPLILENSLNKVLLDNYGTAQTTYKTWTRQSLANDFKTLSRVRISEAPVLDLLPEGGEIKTGTMSESRETYALATYAKGLVFTRQMLINDDLSAFSDLAARMGRAAARFENKTVYSILTANANMADGTPLFDALHGNSGTGTIGNTGLDSMFVAMANQKDLDGVSFLGIVPKYLLTSPARRMTAMQALAESSTAVKPTDRNMYAGMLTLVVDPELTSAAPWYGAAEPSDVEYAYLDGAPGPQMYRTENDGNILGVRFNIFIDFAAKAVGWKGLYFSTGV